LPIEQLFKKIKDLTTKVEDLLKSENEEECASLLAQRQSLLEQLAKDVARLVEENPTNELSSKYLEFLKSIQARDTLSIQFAQKQSQEITIKLTGQVKGKKAIKAYKKLLL
jgi:hypothetical protein